MSSIVLRDVQPGDEEAIIAFLRAFAEFEELSHTFRLTPEIVRRDFIGAKARVQCEFAEWDGKLAGLMVWFRNYSTFQAAPIFYLEDIYVAPEYRRRGVATALLKRLARKAQDEGAVRIDWIVLDWKTRALDVYKRVGAHPADNWRVCRLGGDAIATLARP